MCPYTYGDRCELVCCPLRECLVKLKLKVLVSLLSFLNVCYLFLGVLCRVERRLEIIVRLAFLMVRARLYLRVVLLMLVGASGPRRAWFAGYGGSTIIVS